MSILLETESGWIISHKLFFANIPVEPEFSFAQKESLPSTSESKEKTKESRRYFSLNPILFEITDPFRKISNKKKHSSDDEEQSLQFTETTQWIMNSTKKILTSQSAQIIFQSDEFDKKDETDSESDQTKEGFRWPRSNFKAVSASQDFFNIMKDIKWPRFHGQNPDTMARISDIQSCNEMEQTHHFIFPPMSRFYCNDVSEMKHILCDPSMNEESREKFDLIVIDPPWWNKFIRRKKRKQHEAGYDMITNNEVLSLPIKSLRSDDGLVVIWCTNAKSHQDVILNEMFPAWGLSHHTTLYWIKVTKSGIPICPFNSENKKQPYEVIIIGGAPNKCPKSIGQKLVISIPSCINSHKPPLINVLKRMYPETNFQKNLEVFARYLTPGFTSFGNEVIKLQHISLFKEKK